MEGYILIVDDDQDIRNLVGIYLGNEGFKYIKCDSANKAIELIESHKIDLIILDIMMPELDGIEACIKIRQRENMPIIFISAKSEDMDKIQGLMAGADDYLTKPFNPIELVTRVKAQLRRYKQYNEKYSNNTLLEYEDLVVNRDSRQAWVGGEEVRLTPKEYDILELLLLNKGMALSMAQIYEKVWREDFFRSENTVMVHIAKLRDKLNRGGETKYIQTIWGVGYKL
ncbi:phosphate regulon transcriptional regulatory protein PhoB [Lachnospiraceae bacterium KM106-2]|nr:phosphate regulon transcriptional regulatory protein PhoB [Lachnospiraceae bacterium KM106-2]